MPSSLFFLNSSSPPAAIHLHRSTSGPPRFHPFPESEVRAKLQTSSTSLHLHIRLENARNVLFTTLCNISPFYSIKKTVRNVI
ncbi:hypothetical protein E1A91_D08G064200v1 [Gossypium mustelinum]|uniref:Uncharacterized protein n=1 Tax=Gossypium mustelinum TaxID=34275 RepID=A0A5D2TSP6_GOSMU|nr:hypothetical protein E1A91_D08G064200v1 [Gossypium mustelinum]